MAENEGPFAFIRVRPCKSLQYLAAMKSHALRQDRCLHFDTTKPKPQFLVGTSDIVADVKNRKESIGARFRKGGPYASHLMLHASRSYFTCDRTKFGEIDPRKVDSWVERSLSYLKSKFGDALVNVRVDLDEMTPHMDAFVVHGEKRISRNGHEKIEVSNNALFGGRARLYALHDDYAAFMSPLGLRRGARGAGVQNVHPSVFRERMGSELQEVAQLKSGLLESKRDLEEQKKAQEHRDKELSLREAILAAQHQSLAAGRARIAELDEEYERRKKKLAEQEAELAKSHEKLTHEKESLKRQAGDLNEVRGRTLLLEQILSRKSDAIARQEQEVTEKSQKFADAIAQARTRETELNRVSVQQRSTHRQLSEWQKSLENDRDALEAEKLKMANELKEKTAHADKLFDEAKRAKSAIEQAKSETEKRGKESIEAMLAIIEAMMQGEIEQSPTAGFVISAKVDKERRDQISRAAVDSKPFASLLKATVWPVRKILSDAQRKFIVAQRQALQGQRKSAGIELD